MGKDIPVAKDVSPTIAHTDSDATIREQIKRVVVREEAPASIRASLAFRKACPLAPQRCC